MNNRDRRHPLSIAPPSSRALVALAGAALLTLSACQSTPPRHAELERARQLLPALVDVVIEEPRGPNALPDRSRVAFVVACRRHVVPALLGLDGGGG